MNGFRIGNLWNFMPAALDGIAVIEQAARDGGCRSYTFVAIVFAIRASATFPPERRSPLIPDSMTASSKKASRSTQR